MEVGGMNPAPGPACQRQVRSRKAMGHVVFGQWSAHGPTPHAPEIPHALHMQAHSLSRLGLWQESIDWNCRSTDAALQRPAGAETSLHCFHALDCLA